MNRIYADLHLCCNINDMAHVSRLVSRASILGYRLAAVPYPSRATEQQFNQAKNACEKAGVMFASRVDLRPRTPEELLIDLRRLRRTFEIVAVLCESKAVARQAAKDRRVDLLNFPQPDFRGAFFDEAEAELASACLASLEIDIQPLLSTENTARAKLLSIVQREVQTAQRFHVPIVVSSGVSEELLMRKPAEVVALLSLFNMGGVFAMNTVSRNPMSIVRRNREKLGPRFVAPGIRVIRRGKDC